MTTGAAVVCAAGLLWLAGAAAPGAAPAQPERGSAAERAARRLYDGAPPVIAHPPFGMACAECHGAEGIDVPGAGFAPPSPHEVTAGIGANANCVQCHVWKATDDVFRGSAFSGLAQDLRRGRRLSPGSPPVIPHPVFMRENCRACHTGPAARAAIRTSHPEREACRQCHVERVSAAHFARTAPEAD